MKDPHSTVERLTNALESLATGVGNQERISGVLGLLAPLRADEFPNREARQLFEQIIGLSDNSKPYGDEELRQCFSWVWELYWKMSSNQQFQ